MNQPNYNPDVLTCLANLSNDEVFTPPVVVNQMLDLLPEELWSNPDARFLDPVSKSGVFLREMAKRLDKGLENAIPDKQKRINHILTKQLYGIAITELTALLSRRSAYCSKAANGKYSICEEFDNEQGNVLFHRIEHTWQGGKCKYCGASETVYNRGEELETHAYEFIHTDKPEKIFNNMKFDVIIGNPPYQMSDGGGMGTSAIPLYQEFVKQAKKLNPRFLSMIIPSRWFAGGKGLDEFRVEMLNDNRISKLVDYFDSNDCFPGVDISGGVCYFLWGRDRSGKCEVVSYRNNDKSSLERNLLENGYSTFVRFNEAVSIIRKISKYKETSITSMISVRKPFGFTSSVPNITEEKLHNSIRIYSYPQNGYISIKEVTQNIHWVDKYKVMIAKAYGERGTFPYLVLGKPFIGEPGSCCSETYLVIGTYDSSNTANNVVSYIQTKLFRFLVLLKKNTQNAPRGVYEFVPMQDFSESWTDEKLYKKYGLTEEEIAFIDSMIRPMEITNE